MFEMRKSVLLLVLLAGLALVFMAPRLASAQVLYGSIVGNVTDPTKAVVPGATVTATNKGTNQTWDATSSDSGGFSFTLLPAGAYNLKVSLQGFKEFVNDSVQVANNLVTRVDVMLQIGERTEVVNVTAEAAQLQTDKADVHKDITQNDIANLPSPSLTSIYRNYQSLVDLVAGSTPSYYQNANSDTPARSLTTNVNGTNRYTNMTRLDGATDIIAWLPHHAIYVAPEESVQTVNITTNSFDAEQGLAGGVQIVVQTKSGTNSLHGVVFDYLTNSAFSAANFFTPVGSSAPKYLLSMYGGNLGGPIKKDKLFFFANFEGMKERQSYSMLQTVPTAAMRTGDFSSLSTVIYDPLTGDSTGKGRTAFTGNKIPASRISSVAQVWNALIPQPNVPGNPAVNNFYAAGPEAFDRNMYDVRVDWVRNAKNSIWWKWSRMTSEVDCAQALGAAGGSNLCGGGGAGVATVTVDLATIGYTYTLTPKFLIDGTIGYTLYNPDGKVPDYGINFGLDTLHIPGTNGPDPKQGGKPQFYFTNYSTLGDTEGWMPFYRADHTTAVAVNASWSHGKHDIRFGPDINRWAMNHWQPEAGNGPRGSFTFTNGTTALNGGKSPDQYNSFAQFLLGLPDSMSKTLQNYSPMSTREWQIAMYFRDRWQVRSNLTISLGMRWEHYPIVNRAHWGIERYDYSPGSPTANQVLIGGEGGNPLAMGSTASWKLFAPRFGIAYRMGKLGVLRGGYGITYDPYPTGRPMRAPYPAVEQFTNPAANSFTYFAPILTGIPNIPFVDVTPGKIPIPYNISTVTLPPGQFERGYIQSWNLVYERELPSKFVWNIGYIATRSIHITANQNLNAAAPGAGTAGEPLNVLFGRNAGTNLVTAWPNGIYDSLQTTLERRFTNDFGGKVVYTWSHCIDESDDASTVPYGYIPLLGRNRADCGYDRRQNMRLALSYVLPFGHGKRWGQSRLADVLAGGWQFNGVLSLVAGQPFTVTASSASLNAPGNTQLADQVSPSVNRLGGIGLGHPYFDPTAYAPVTQVRFGNSGRDQLVGPGLTELDVSGYKNVKLTERFGLQFKAECFNMTNTPNFNNPNANASTTTNFMTITSAQANQRTMRFGLRIFW